MGEEPQSMEKAASERNRSGLSPAATRSAAAVSAPTPNVWRPILVLTPHTRAQQLPRDVDPSGRQSWRSSPRRTNRLLAARGLLRSLGLGRRPLLGLALRVRALLPGHLGLLSGVPPGRTLAATPLPSPFPVTRTAGRARVAEVWLCRDLLETRQRALVGRLLGRLEIRADPGVVREW